MFIVTAESEVMRALILASKYPVLQANLPIVGLFPFKNRDVGIHWYLKY